MTQGIVNIRGKEYQTVAFRVNKFRGECPIEDGWGILTKVISADSTSVCIACEITNPKGEVVGCGHAEEVRGASAINKTSALENCETSAIGRALASCGYGGEEYATANEVNEAIAQQNQAPRKPPIDRQMVDTFRRNVEGKGQDEIKAMSARVKADIGIDESTEAAVLGVLRQAWKTAAEAVPA